LIRCVFIAFLLSFCAPAIAHGTGPVQGFLQAADKDDKVKMASLIDGSKGLASKAFFKKLEGCYLRRLYETPDIGIAAAWMCVEDNGKSRVLIAQIATSGEQVSVNIVSEQTNNRPAPPRSGPVFLEDHDHG